MAFNYDDTDNTLENVTSTNIGRIWRPTRRGTWPLQDPADMATQLRTVQLAPSVIVSSSGTTVLASGNPFQLLSLSATQEPSRQQDRVFSKVFISWTHVADSNFQGLRVWFKGYKGNSNPTLMADLGLQAPGSFLCEATGETVTVIGQPSGLNGHYASLDGAVSSTVTLSGAISAPPAPSINQTLVGTPTGFQFSFNQINLGGTQDVVDSYRVYRNTSNTFAGSALIQTIKHSPTNTGAVVVTDTINAATGANYYYFITAVDTQGLESAATAAQAASTPGSAGSIPPSLIQSMSYSATTTSLTWSWTGVIIYRADGTTTSVPDGSRATTGLTASTTYYFYPYWDETTQTLLWVNGSGNGSTGEAFTAAQRTATVAQQQGLRNRIPVSTGPMTAATTASGTTGGSGGGDGICIRSTMLVEEKTKGIVPAHRIVVGDYLATPLGWSRVEQAQELPAQLFMRIGVDGRFIEVIPTHPFSAMDEVCRSIEHIKACQLTFLHQLYTRVGAAFVQYMKLITIPDGTKMLLSLSDVCHTFYAGEAEPYIVAHNVRLAC